jgi:hypothetical protein
MPDTSGNTAPSHGLTPSPPSASTSSASTDQQLQNQNFSQTLTLSQTPDPNQLGMQNHNNYQNQTPQQQPQAQVQTQFVQPNSDMLSFTAADLGGDTSFLDDAGDFDFGLSGLGDGSFDFTMYLAEQEDNPDGGEVGVV